MLPKSLSKMKKHGLLSEKVGWQSPSLHRVAGLVSNGLDLPSMPNGELKRKLRDVRGDTFLTMTIKMVPHLVAKMSAMSPFDGMRGPPSLLSLSDMAASARATYLRFVGLLPTDMLAARDYLGQTAMMPATDDKDAELVKILIDRMVDLDARDTLGRTALHAAVRCNAIDCFKLLLGAGANPTLATFEGKTPAIFAAEFGRAQFFSTG